MIAKKIIITIVSVMLCVAFVCNFAGCSFEPSKSTNKSSDAYLEYGQDAAQYTTFLDKEITPITNYLMSNMTLLRGLVPSENRDIKSESSALRTAKNDLKEIKIIHERIEKMPAGKGYESNKKRVLKIINDIEQIFTDYIDDLKNLQKEYVGYSGFSVYQKQFSNLYIELTDEFTSYYK